MKNTKLQVAIFLAAFDMGVVYAAAAWTLGAALLICLLDPSVRAPMMIGACVVCCSWLVLFLAVKAVATRACRRYLRLGLLHAAPDRPDIYSIAR